MCQDAKKLEHSFYVTSLHISAAAFFSKLSQLTARDQELFGNTSSKTRLAKSFACMKLLKGTLRKQIYQNHCMVKESAQNNTYYDAKQVKRVANVMFTANKTKECSSSFNTTTL